MGAAIALRLAVTRPELVKALVLARPAWVTDAAPNSLAPTPSSASCWPITRRSRRRPCSTPRRCGKGWPARRPTIWPRWKSLLSREPLPVTSALLSAIALDGPGVTPDEVAAIAVPTLVIGHERDVIHPLAHARALARMIPGARLVEITPKAHDKARYLQEFRAALLAFLDTID